MHLVASNISCPFRLCLPGKETICGHPWSTLWKEVLSQLGNSGNLTLEESDSKFCIKMAVITSALGGWVGCTETDFNAVNCARRGFKFSDVHLGLASLGTGFPSSVNPYQCYSQARSWAPSTLLRWPRVMAQDPYKEKASICLWEPAVHFLWE